MSSKSWAERLEQAEKRGHLTGKELEKLQHFNTCFVGEALKRAGIRNSGGMTGVKFSNRLRKQGQIYLELEEKLVDLGMDVSYTENVPELKTLHQQINDLVDKHFLKPWEPGPVIDIEFSLTQEELAKAKELVKL